MKRTAFKRDPVTRDLVLSGGRFVIVSDIDVVLQNCDHALRQQLGELRYSQTKGVEYFGNVFNGTPNFQLFKFQAITELEKVSGVIRVQRFDFSIVGGELDYTAIIETEYGAGRISSGLQQQDAGPQTFQAPFIPVITPKLNVEIDLRNGQPNRWIFNRSSVANYVNASGEIAQASIDDLRVQHDFVSLENLGGLIEGSRTNRLINSADFTNEDWVKTSDGTGTDPVVTGNAAISPRGILEASQIDFNSGAGVTSDDQSFVQQILAPTNGNQAGGIWLKGANGGEQIVWRVLSSSTHQMITLTEEWVRYSRTELAAASLPVLQFGIRQAVTGTVNSTATVYAWNGQIESGNFTSSDIITGEFSESRELDDLKIPLSSVAGWKDGEPFEITVSGWTAEGIGSNSQILFSISDGTLGNMLAIYRGNTTQLAMYMVKDGIVNVQFAGGPLVIGKHRIKIIAHFESANCWFSMSVDDGPYVIYGPDLFNEMPIDLTTIIIGNRPDGLRAWFGEIEKFKMTGLS